MTVGTADTQKSTQGAPRSWAEDLNSYRATRGSQSYAKLDTVPTSYGRTALVPFAATKHQLYSYNDFPNQDGGAKTQQDPAVQTQRYNRHGWGDTSLLKEDGYAGVPHPRQGGGTPSGKKRPNSPRAKDGRNGLFGVLQQTEKGGMDSWIGHSLIQPGTGKASVALPPDPRGRRDLFDVLHARNPGTPSDDTWLGNPLINPAKGKASVPGPEQRRGRKDLTDTFTQSILRESNKADLLRKGVDPLADAWCGHQLIDPSKGKLPIHCAASEDVMLGGTFKPPVPSDWTDFKKRHTKLVATTIQDTARQVLNGTAPLDASVDRRGKKFVPEATGDRLVPRPDLYANMTYRPLSAQEKQAYALAWDDKPHITGTRTITAPGSDAHGKGLGMLEWHPEEAIGQFVPYGKLAQVGRSTKPARIAPGGTMGRPMPIPRALSMESTRRF